MLPTSIVPLMMATGGAAAGTALGSLLSGKPKVPQPPAQMQPVQSPVGQKPSGAKQQTSLLSQPSAPPVASGSTGKTLLGQ